MATEAEEQAPISAKPTVRFVQILTFLLIIFLIAYHLIYTAVIIVRCS